MQADFWDHNVDGKISIPVDLEGQVCKIDWLIQFFNLMAVQLILRIFKAINGTYKSFLQNRIIICMLILARKNIVYIKDNQWVSEAHIQSWVK